jgi:hypothetical protein
VEGENTTSGPQPYQPYEGGDYHLPYFQHSPMGIRASMGQNSDIQAPPAEASKLPRLKRPSSPGSYTEQYHTKLIRLPEACPRVPGGYTFLYRLVPARGHPRFPGGYAFIYRLVLARGHPRFPGGYTLIYRLVLARGHPRLAMLLLYRLSPPEAIHGWLCFCYTVCPRPRPSTVWC